MKSKRVKKTVKLRNVVAANPLLGKSGRHEEPRSNTKLSRSKLRRDLRKAHKNWRDDLGQPGKDNWQSNVSLASVLRHLEVSLCQLSFPQLSVLQITALPLEAPVTVN